MSDNNDASHSPSDSTVSAEAGMHLDSASAEPEAGSNDALVAIYELLEANIYNYDAHVALVSMMASLGDLEGIRQARESMSDIFPLPENMWLDWLGEEMALAVKQTEKQSLMALFQRATNDYLSISIWKMYLDYVFEEFNDSVEDGTQWLSIESVRGICSAARKATDMHFTKSDVIWNTVKDFEMTQLEKDPRPENIESIRKMFMDRFKQHHQEIDKTLEEYSPFESLYDPDQYVVRLKLATQYVSKTKHDQRQRETLERKLEQSMHSLDSFEAYLAAEKRHANGGDVMFIQTLYERAISLHCLHPTLWESYILFMATKDKLPTTLVSISGRAVRNCMGSGPLWCHSIRIKAMARRPRSTIRGEYQRALGFLSLAADHRQVLALCLCFCEVELRYMSWDDECTLESVRTMFDEMFTFLNAIQTCDLVSKLLLSWACFEEYSYKDIPAARDVYHMIVKHVCTSSDAWLEFVRFECRHDNIPKARSLLKQATLQTTDFPEKIQEYWVEFERIHGNIESTFEAFDKILLAQNRLTKMGYNREAYHTQQVNIVPVVQLGPMAAVGSSSDLQKQPALNEFVPSGTSLSNGSKKRSAKETDNESHPKRTKVEGTDKDETKETSSGKLPSSLAEYKVINNSMAGNMVYLPQLSQHTNESSLRRQFGKYGRIVDLCLQPNEESGELEAFIEMANAEVVRNIVLNGPTQINDCLITPCRCRPSQMVWDFKLQEERTKIYISELSPFVEKQHLRRVFSEFGKIREIRLQNRKTMSFAYIDFESEENAIKSLKMNHSVIEKTGDRKISVAISDPTKRKVKDIDPRKLYISNIPHTTTEEDLKELFEKFGPISAPRVARMPNGHSRGIAFVEFNEEADAKEAMTLNGTMLDGRLMIVSVSDPNIGRTNLSKSTNDTTASSSKGKTQNALIKDVADAPQTGPSVPTSSMQFTPRAVRAPKQRQRPLLAHTSRKQIASTSEPSSSDHPSQIQSDPPHSDSPKTQDDFRKLILNQK
ncbi:hypothetical protein BASA62_000289 [Batrachochytrium salamandrivorans]|nr:hypothetical protein BASA62_000289 [Batrachochytrium salamandrivorans]